MLVEEVANGDIFNYAGLTGDMLENVSEEISYYSLDELTINNPIFPHQPSLSKSQNIDDIGLYWNKNYYNQNSYNHKDLITVDIEGTLRSVRIGNLNINPMF